MKIGAIRRFSFIETRLLYGGGITARELGDMFGLSRQAAQSVISQYCTLHPGNIERDFSKGRQVAPEGFEPKYIRANVRLFLDHLRGQALSGFFLEEAEWGEDVCIEDVSSRIQPKVQVDAVHDLLLGLYEKCPVYAVYRSKTGISDRMLSPHGIIYAHNRYLVRCYCHNRLAFLDFSLSRFVETQLVLGQEWVSGREDREWNEYTALEYQPNPALPLETQKALREDYMLGENEVFQIKCRKALAIYVIREMEGGGASRAKWVRSDVTI